MGCGASRGGLKAVGELTTEVEEDKPGFQYPEVVVLSGMPWPGCCWYNGGYIKQRRATKHGRPVYRRDEDTIAELKDMKKTDVPLPPGGMLPGEIYWYPDRSAFGFFRDSDSKPMRWSIEPFLVGQWSGGCKVHAVKAGPANLAYDEAALANLSTGVQCKYPPLSTFRKGYPDATFTAQGLPPALSVDTDGMIVGTPSTAGPFSATITASNDKGSCTVHLELNVQQGQARKTSTTSQPSISQSITDALAKLRLDPVADHDGEHKFAARQLIMGDAMLSATGLRDAIGLGNQTLLSKLLQSGWDAIECEWLATGDAADEANYRYIRFGKARDPADIPRVVQEQIAAGFYHGGRLEAGDFDKGHDGMTLQDFVEHPTSKLAHLSEFNVFALRAYTSGSFPRFNKPLRESMNPHPLKMTVYYLDEGLRKLRAVEAQDRVAYTAVKELYRGLKNMTIDGAKFQMVGGTELACMSTTATLDVALKYANSEAPLLFRYMTRGNSRGVSISFLSLFPTEDEFLYPPLTLLLSEGEASTEAGVCIYDVTPQFS